MKKEIILFTQRVDIVPNYGERRNSSDQQWVNLIRDCGCIAVPAVNDRVAVEELLTVIKPSLLLLTGGNNLMSYQGDAPERDELEAWLITYGIEHKIPILGVCRGMQMLQCHFGGQLSQVENHVAVKHIIHMGDQQREVNSYHNLGITMVADGFVEIARSENGVVEAMQHKHHAIYAMMWHPERPLMQSEEDVLWIKEIMKRGNRQ